MAISRMQEPRQLYGLGSLVKSIGKGVKKLIKSPVGKGLLLAGGFGLAGMGPFAGLANTKLGTTLFGMVGPGSGAARQGGILSGALDKLAGLGTGGKLGIGTGIATYLLSQGKSKEEIEAITQDRNALSGYLREYFTKLNPDAQETEIQEFIDVNTREYDATGGRVGFAEGKVPFPEEEFKKFLQEKGEFEKMKNQNRMMQEFLQYLKRNKPIAVKDGGRIGLKDSVKFMTEKELEETMPGLARGEVKNYELKKKANRMEKLMELLREYEKNKKAAGGMPTGIMRTNKAGVLERDYRDEGGFVPVGIKERADDVPAMLSKNEFVMTADAVRGAGDGSIEKGAQRMYDQMKNLESKVA